MAKKRVMTEFEITEVSAVDRPAQEHAKAEIMKNADAEVKKTGVVKMPKTKLVTAITKRFLSESDGAVSFSDAVSETLKDEKFRDIMELCNPVIWAMDTSMRSIIADPDLSSDIKQMMLRNTVEGFLAIVREKWPRVEQVLQKVLVDEEVGEVTKGVEKMAADKNDTAADLQKQIDALTKKLTALQKDDDGGDSAKERIRVNKATDGSDDDEDKMQKQIDDAKAALEKSEVEKAEALLKADMTDAEKAHYAKFADDDADGKAKFGEMTHEKRAEVIAKAAKADDVLKVDDIEIRKSVVGDAQFAIFKSMAERVEKAEKNVALETEARKSAEVAKRIDTELKDFSGTEEEKISVLKAIDGMDEDAKKALGTMLKAGGAAIGAAFETIGHGGEGDVSKSDKLAFTTKVAEIRKRDDCTRAEAMTKARLENPDLYKAYQGTSDAAN